jgi:hypothetical protein
MQQSNYAEKTEISSSLLEEFNAEEEDLLLFRYHLSSHILAVWQFQENKEPILLYLDSVS